MDYDFVIAGAGVSGLCLADALTQQLPSCSILLIDPDQDPDYNISFWREGETPYPELIKQSWQQITVRYGAEQRMCPLTRYQLQAFWRSDFDAFLGERLRKTGQVDFIDAPVIEVQELGEHVEVRTPSQVFKAAWLFDSRPKAAEEPDLLAMAGLAQEVSTERAVFDPSTATLFDFVLDTPHFDFFYVLPYTQTTALVNYAVITPDAGVVPTERCAREIERYLTEQLKVGEYVVGKSCYGRIPLASRWVSRQTTGRVLDIGARGGRIKPSTSYAFARILADTEQLAQALLTTGQPFYHDTPPWYYRLADLRMVQVFRKHPTLAQRVMYSLFSESDGDLTLAFLDEKNSLHENEALVELIPKPLLSRFLAALVLS